MTVSNTSSTSDTSTELRWVYKPAAVCPDCLIAGHLEYQEDSWDHRCPRTNHVWTWKQYRAAVSEAARRWAA